jgi:hypothetical protein
MALPAYMILQLHVLTSTMDKVMLRLQALGLFQASSFENSLNLANKYLFDPSFFKLASTFLNEMG